MHTILRRGCGRRWGNGSFHARPQRRIPCDAFATVQGLLHARFFHGGYLAGRLKEGQKLVLHGKAERDPYRPGRLEMVNPQIELVSGADGEPADSTEVGRIVPIYEAMGGISSRMLRRIIYQALLNFDGNLPDPAARRDSRTPPLARRDARPCFTRTSRPKTRASNCSTAFGAPRTFV